VRTLFKLLPLAAALALSGCGQLDLTPEGNPSRVVTGQVEVGEDAPLPADTVVTVRIVDASAVGMAPQVLGSQTIKNPGVTPIPFRVEYRAEDEVLRHGLNIEVRVSFDGKVRYYNQNHHVVTLGNASEAHRINVTPVGP
jgi:uncharacterized lipoprotein YbaY